MADKVSKEQIKEMLDDLAKQHPAMAKVVGIGVKSRAVKKLWNDLANRLNAFGSGSTKTGEEWKKYWADLREESMNRLAERGWDALGTVYDHSEVDYKVLDIIGEVAVFGIREVRIPFCFSIDKEIKPELSSSQQIVNEQAHKSYTALLKSPVNSSGQINRVGTHKVESPLSQPKVHHPRLRPIRTINSPRISKWNIALERKRVEAEQKLANAALIMAEASRVQAHTARELVDVTRGQMEIQFEDIKALLEMTRASRTK